MRRIAAIAVSCAMAVTLWLGACSKPPERLDEKLWHTYAERFVTADGRVMDRDSDPAGISHTEGQGYGMLLAEAAGDRAAFERIWRWTRDHLQRRDGLFAWKYGACGQPSGCVLDNNNASDGDILIAWALLRAGKAWGRADYLQASRTIADTVADRLIVQVGGTSLLLPGAEGFENGNAVVVNPSYWVFPAFTAFAETFQQPAWTALAESSQALLRQARFGRWNLPPDWLRVEAGRLAPAPDFPPQYGFNAVRVPLNLMWGNRADATLLEPYRAFWSSFQNGQVPPAWTDLATNAVAPYGWQTGMAAIAALADGTADMPQPRADEGYYSWSLALLSRVAQAETAR